MGMGIGRGRGEGGMGGEGYNRSILDCSNMMTVLCACVAAFNDPKLFTKVLENGDVLGNLRKNWLEADAEILDNAGDMGRYCTFLEPNGNKCGFRLGAITRDMIVGLEAAIVV